MLENRVLACVIVRKTRLFQRSPFGSSTIQGGSVRNPGATRVGLRLTRRGFRFRRRDQTELGVEDVDQVIEVAGAVGIIGRFEQFLTGPHLSLDVGAALGEQGFQDGLGRLLVDAMVGRGSRGAEGLFEERQADAFRAAHLPERGRGPRLPFHHLGEERQAHGDDLVVLGQSRDRLIQERLVILAEIARGFGQRPVGPPECHQDFPGMTGIEKVHQGAVLSFDQADFQVAHEPAGGEPEIIPDQHHGLDMLAIAVPERGDELGVRLAPPGMEPLLELVEDQEHLPLGRQEAAPAQVGQRIDQPRGSGQFRTDLAHALEQTGFGLLRRRLDVNRQDVPGQPGQETRLDHRRLAATTGPVDQPHAKRLVGIERLDLALPEPEALGQSVPVAGPGSSSRKKSASCSSNDRSPFGTIAIAR